MLRGGSPGALVWILLLLWGTYWCCLCEERSDNNDGDSALEGAAVESSAGNIGTKGEEEDLGKIDSQRHIIVDILNPKNHSMIGTRINLSFQLLEVVRSSAGAVLLPLVYHTDHNIHKFDTVNWTAGVDIALFVGDRQVFKASNESKSHYFDISIDDASFVIPGFNILTIEVSVLDIASQERRVISSAHSKLYSMAAPLDPNFDALLGRLRVGPPHRAYSIIGFDSVSRDDADLTSTSGWNRLLLTNGNRYEVFDGETTPSPESDNFCTLFKKGAGKLVHCWPLSKYHIGQVLFVDYSLVYFTALEKMAQGNPRVLDDLLSSIILSSTSSIWIFVRLDDPHANRYMEQFEHPGTNDGTVLTFTRTVFTSADDQTDSHVVLGRYVVWILNTHVHTEMVVRSLEQVRESKSKSDMQSFVPGKAHILLENACLLRHENMIVLFNEDFPTTRLVNMTYLAEDEDRGFLYTGYQIVETALSDLRLAHLSDPNRYRWLPGVSALSIGVQGGHIVHEIEPLLQFMFMTVASSAESGNLMSSAAFSKRQRTLAQAYHAMTSTLKRIIFLTLTGPQLNDWLLSTLGVLLRHGLHDRSSLRDFAFEAYLKDHLFENTDFDGICFDKVLLLGRSNAHVTFFGNSQLASVFRKFVYDKYDIPCDAGSCREWTMQSGTGFGIDNDYQSSFLDIPTIRRDRPLRITIGVRSDRKIGNFAELLASIRALGNIDEYWLDTHLLSFEALSFEEQVRVMADSDVFISTHGASVINGLFMRTNSVVIDIFNGPFFESVFEPPLREAGVRLLYVPVIDKDRQTYDCPDPSTVPQQCINASSIVLMTRDIRCVGVRRCSVYVDKQLFESVLNVAYFHILTSKWIH
jgi:hypothetical protein